MAANLALARRMLAEEGFEYSDDEMDGPNVEQAFVEPVNIEQAADQPTVFISSEKGKQQLNRGGFLFWKHKNSTDGTKTFWRCDRFQVTKCQHRIHTNADTTEVVKELGKHNHGKSAATIQVRTAKQAIKAAAVETMHHPAQIFNNVLGGMPQAVQAKLDKSASRKTVQRTRKQLNQTPALPNAINFVIPESYKNYRFGVDEQELFLLCDSNDTERILIFGRESNKNWARRMKVVFMDGTFKITPAPFCQVYIMLAERGGYVFPVLYCLLPNKSQVVYEKMLQMIRELWPNFYPNSVSVDFEQAVINALHAKFPPPPVNPELPGAFGPQCKAVEVQGCFFHLVQNMKKKLAENHLKSRYETDADFAVQCRMITSMAFVPPADLIRVFDELWELMPPELEPVMIYFQKNYIGSITRRANRNVVVDPKFSHLLWSVYERTLKGSHRTNNYAEAANHRIQCELDVCHPGIWGFIDLLRIVQQGRDKLFIDWQSGKQAKGKRIKYKKADASILNIVESYAERNTQEYLKGLANNYEMDD